MEKEGVGDVNILLELLSQAIKEMSQLVTDVDESQKPTAQKIQFNIKEAYSVAKMYQESSEQQACRNNEAADSPGSNSNSPRSENSQRVFREQERKEMRKKRKSMVKRTKQVSILPNGESEGIDDGHSWRKYGQKEILGAKYPRAYYRCTYRKTMGCQATKLVQRSDSNPYLLDITYRGEHICLRAQKLKSPSPSYEPAMLQKHQNPSANKESTRHNQSQQLLLNFQTSLKIETKNSLAEDQSLTSFSFPSTPASNLEQESHFFSAPATLDNNYVGSISTSFASPATSESNHLPVSPPVSSYMGTQTQHAPESELDEIIQAAMSGSSFVFDQREYVNSFSLDSPNFF